MMDSFNERDFPNTHDFPHALNWLPSHHHHHQQSDTDQIMDVSPLEVDFLDYWAPPFAYQSKQLCFNEFPELENIGFNDFDLPPLDENFVVDEKPLNMVVPSSHITCIKREPEKQIQEASVPIPGSTCKRASALNFNEIKKHFNVPINEAAKEMNVGLTLLKRRCRELNIMRWPHRKLKSLKLLIDNVKEMGLDSEVAMLEQQQKMLEKKPGLEFTKETKKLRQACFKANYKKRKYLAQQS